MNKDRNKYSVAAMVCGIITITLVAIFLIFTILWLVFILSGTSAEFLEPFVSIGVETWGIVGIPLIPVTIVGFVNGLKGAKRYPDSNFAKTARIIGAVGFGTFLGASVLYIVLSAIVGIAVIVVFFGLIASAFSMGA